MLIGLIIGVALGIALDRILLGAGQTLQTFSYDEAGRVIQILEKESR